MLEFFFVSLPYFTLDDLTSTEILLLKICEGLSIFATLIVIILGSCCLLAFFAAPQFHWNMILLVSNFAIICIIYSLSEICSAIAVIICDENELCFYTDFMFMSSAKAIGIVKLASSVCNILAMPALIVERVMATIYFKVYEKHQHIYFVASHILFQWIASFISAFLLVNKFLPFFPMVILSIIVCLLFIIAFFITDHINHRRYNHSLIHGNSYTLSERYQLCENIRTSSLMRRCAIVCTICLTITATFLALQVVLENFRYKLLCKILFKFSASFYALLFIANALKTNC